MTLILHLETGKYAEAALETAKANGLPSVDLWHRMQEDEVGHAHLHIHASVCIVCMCSCVLAPDAGR